MASRRSRRRHNGEGVTAPDPKQTKMEEEKKKCCGCNQVTKKGSSLARITTLPGLQTLIQNAQCVHGCQIVRDEVSNLGRNVLMSLGAIYYCLSGTLTATMVEELHGRLARNPCWIHEACRMTLHHHVAKCRRMPCAAARGPGEKVSFLAVLCGKYTALIETASGTVQAHRLESRRPRDYRRDAVLSAE